MFERRGELAEFGAGLQITPNASRVLEKLGALGFVEALAFEPGAIVIRRGGDGSELARLAIADARRRWGAPYLVIHRADLQRALADACFTQPGIELRLGFAVGGVAETADGVTFGLKRGLLSVQENGDLAIGADGLRSKVRERLGFGEAEKPEFSGRVAFRATVPASELPPSYGAPKSTSRSARAPISSIIRCATGASSISSRPSKPAGATSPAATPGTARPTSTR